MKLVGVVVGLAVVVLVVVGYELLMKLAKKENESKPKKQNRNGK
jgi:hypothetical protein